MPLDAHGLKFVCDDGGGDDDGDDCIDDHGDDEYTDDDDKDRRDECGKDTVDEDEKTATLTMVMNTVRMIRNRTDAITRVIVLMIWMLVLARACGQEPHCGVKPLSSAVQSCSIGETCPATRH